VVVEQVDHREVVHQVVPTEKARQDFQVVKVVTLDHNHIQVQEVAEVEPRQYTLMAQKLQPLEVVAEVLEQEKALTELQE
tara:strand:+ start:467 stop:706 length:240 start_codon:yes stop_codon:yes gene_type:complete